MHTVIKTVFAALALSTLALSAQAGPLHDAADPAYVSNSATPRVDARQARQHARIAQGVARGEITAQERQRLARQQRAIALAEARAKADGVVTPRERRQLDAMQDHAGRSIHRQAQDDDRRGERHAAYGSRW